MALDDSYSKILLHLNGADESTTITDESGKSWDVYGNAQIDTSQSKFGGASLYLDGSSYIYTADHDDFAVGYNDWTFEMFVRPDSSASGIVAFGGQYVNSSNYLMFRYNWSTYELYAIHRYVGSNRFSFSCTVELSKSAWSHVAIVRSGDSPLIFANGISQSVSETVAISGKPIYNLTGDFKIGTVVADGWLGHIDEHRFSADISRYTSDFTPPIREFGASVMPVLQSNRRRWAN